MKKSQIVILCASIILVLLIFQLPKVLVSSERQLKKEDPVSASAEDPDHTDHDEFEEAHSMTNAQIDRQKLENYKNQLKNFSKSEKVLTFADSISNIFKKAGAYDSAAYYMALKAEYKGNSKNLEDAGEAYFEAFSASGGRNKELNDKARSFYLKAQEKDPTNLQVKAKLAMTYVATENPMQGIAILREILEKDPGNEEALYNLGILSIQSGQFDKAVDRFKDLLKVNPEHANGHFYLGLAYLNSGKTKNAREEFELAKTLESDPGFQSIVDSYLKEIK